MSRIGKMPIVIPDGVTFSLKAGAVDVSGSKGHVSVDLPLGFTVEVKGNEARVVSRGQNRADTDQHGLIRALLFNAVTGVSQSWHKTLELVGVGYRAHGDGTDITLNVGFSHPVKISAPTGITFEVVGNNKVTVSGVDKKLVGEVAARIRAVSPPEPYKGKGIRYVGEVVRRKAGKAVKAVGAATG